jgi:hypothetical protein
MFLDFFVGKDFIAEGFTGMLKTSDDKSHGIDERAVGIE